MPLEENQEPEATPEDLDFYYGLSHQRAAPAHESAHSYCLVGALIGALLFAPLGAFGLYLMFVTIPLCAVIGGAIGAVTGLGINSFVQTYFTRKDP